MCGLFHRAGSWGWLGIVALGVLLGMTGSVYAQSPEPPPEPEIAPLIGREYPTDADHNKLDDDLQDQLAAAQDLARNGATPEDRAAGEAALASLVDVELIFTARITSDQIHAFQLQGGIFDYFYLNVSYGWNGRVPLGKLQNVIAAMGGSLVLVDEPKHTVLHMDIATRSGRVRPVWAANFAGNASGFDGNANITIAIVDTGIDGTHTDLAGRQQFWKDYTTDALASAADLIQHGSHVAGIALGTGASGGSATGTLFYTDENDYTNVPVSSFFPSGVGLPAVSLTVTSTAKWVGGGGNNGHLYLFHHTDGTSPGSVVQQSSPTNGIDGLAGITETNTFTPLLAETYLPTLLSNGSMGKYVIANSVTNYPGVGDGFNKFRGVAPGCKWAGAKVFKSSGSGSNTWCNSAIDDLVSKRAANNIKIMNLSLGTIGDPGLDTSERQKVNSAVNNGILLTISAGNDGTKGTTAKQTIDDPGRAAMALTVGASNDVNALTDYSSIGFTSPGSTVGQEEDYKPDIVAPGGSTYYTSIMSVDSNTGDGSAFSDQKLNDYFNISGTSMSSPFTAGCAALVIDAMQQAGTTWSFASGQHPKFVKMVLCATATETNVNREDGTKNPTLQRAAAGPNSYPAGKDQYEGYGMINPDAAVEAVTLTQSMGSSAGDTLGSTFSDRRAWARKVNFVGGTLHVLNLDVPATGDYDLYLYSSTPSNYGTPVILASSTNAGNGVDEAINYTPVANGTGLLVVKRVSGNGAFVLNTAGGESVPPAIENVTSTIANGIYGAGVVIPIQVIFTESVNVTGTPQLALKTTPPRTANYASGQGSAVLVFNYTIQPGDLGAFLDYASTNALTLNGGSIKDVATNNAILTLAAPGAAHSLAANKAILVDGAIPGDYDHDGDVDGLDLVAFNNCFTGPAIPQNNLGCAKAKFDGDADVDQADYAVWQRCFSGSGHPGNPNCAN